jgi:multiple antibiotic resistance protein
MLESLLTYVVLTAGSLFAVVNPFATVPPFVAMTTANTVAERQAMARRASIIACVVLLAFALFGLQVLTFFGVTIPAFQVAGGLVLVRVAFGLLQGGDASLKVTPEERLEGLRKDDISVTPLGVPLLCGPATITVAILLSSQASSYLHTIALLLVIGTVYTLLYVMLRLASVHSHRLGEAPVRVTSRLMGLILVAVAVQFIFEGIRDARLFPGV